MNKDQIEGSWKQFSGALKEKWGRLTDDDATVIAGIRERLEGSLQERHGYGNDPAHSAARITGAGRWKALNAHVEGAFGDLRAMLEFDAGRSASTRSGAPAAHREQ